MKFKHLIIALFFLGAAIDSNATTPLTSGLVLTHISSVGAKQAIADYFGKAAWMKIKNGIATGSDGWLKVYTSLEPVADGEAGEDLSESISKAIPVRPFKVIPILSDNEHLTTEQLCTFTFEAKIPEGGINTYLDHLDDSLNKASSQRERDMADACRRGIKTTRKAFAKGAGDN